MLHIQLFFSAQKCHINYFNKLYVIKDFFYRGYFLLFCQPLPCCHLFKKPQQNTTILQWFKQKYWWTPTSIFSQKPAKKTPGKAGTTIKLLLSQEIQLTVIFHTWSVPLVEFYSEVLTHQIMGYPKSQISKSFTDNYMNVVFGIKIKHSDNKSNLSNFQSLLADKY